MRTSKPAKRSAKPATTDAASIPAPAADATTVPPVNPEPVANATVAKPDASAAKRERIIADRERCGRLYASLAASVSSIPVKPLSAYKPRPASANPNRRDGLSLRAAAASVLAIANSGVTIPVAADGKPVGDTVEFPRAFTLRDGDTETSAILENGTVGDMLSAGVATVAGSSPTDERITLSVRALLAHFGIAALRHHGIATDAA